MKETRFLSSLEEFLKNGKNPGKTWEEYLAVFCYVWICEFLNRPAQDTNQITDALDMCGICVTLAVCDLKDSGVIKIEEGKVVIDYHEQSTPVPE